MTFKNMVRYLYPARPRRLAAALAVMSGIALTAGSCLPAAVFADAKETCDCSCSCDACGCGRDSVSGSGAVSDSEAGKTGMINPWQETEALEEACEGAGILTDGPIPQALPKEGMELHPFRYMDGTLEMIYTDKEDELTIRMSVKEKGFDLTGDYNTYAKEWDENYKGLLAHCRGDGETINAAVFEGMGVDFAVMYNSGQEGRGLTSDQLKSLVMCLQAEPMENGTKGE